jgi:hypothetical protein
MSAVVQGELPLSRRAMPVAVPLEMITARKSLLGALNLCMDASGLDDKEISASLDIDAGHFANIRKGKGHFPPDKINPLMDLCGNEVPLTWLSMNRGYVLVQIESETQRLLRIEREKLKEAERENELLKKLLTGKV